VAFHEIKFTADCKVPTMFDPTEEVIVEPALKSSGISPTNKVKVITNTFLP